MDANHLLRPTINETGHLALQQLAANRISRYFGIHPEMAGDMAAAVLAVSRKYLAEAGMQLPDGAGLQQNARMGETDTPPSGR